MIYEARKGQVSYGESIGILLLDTFAPFIPGDVGNATTYSYPVRFRKVEGFSVTRLFNKDLTALDAMVEACQELVNEGVKAITGDCGYMALFQKELAERVEVPIFLSSLLQVPFISQMLSKDEKVGIICADSRILDRELLAEVGVHATIPVCISGLENKEYFYQAAIEEVGTLDAQQIESEVVTAAKEMVEKDPMVKAILLECSMLPPYAAAVQEAVKLPVFDYVTMINYVHSSLVKNRYEGYM
ncbi:aspartate/glutamate racemase family protein [Neobacillus jeddahensis]|uniref:aspartate/glutamate racemase family protein n=1 Tax=Neobacillus jeddahensis TaxID=1461580 RepID=UPI00058C2C40|nr:aspartate/glutamate racemase family protein [Neobacillus jeddahensis]